MKSLRWTTLLIPSPPPPPPPNTSIFLPAPVHPLRPRISDQCDLAPNGVSSPVNKSPPFVQPRRRVRK